jgi:tetratricopeptide (TPR) repeat protein
MTAHIFMALGMWGDVVSANENAERVVGAELAKHGQPNYRCGHYAEWLEYGYFQQGREQKALQVLADCESQGPAAVAWFREHPGQRFGAAPTPEALQERIRSSLYRMRGMAVVDSADYAAAFATRDLGLEELAADSETQNFARGLAEARAGKLGEAETSLRLLSTTLKEPPAPDASATDRAYIQVMALMLEGAIAQAQNKTETALAKTAEAAKIYGAMAFDFGPPVPLKPPHEMAGEILLAAGRPKEALSEFDMALEWAPLRAASLLGRARALSAIGSKSADAEFKLLDGLWRDADPARRALLVRPAR